MASTPSPRCPISATTKPYRSHRYLQNHTQNRRHDQQWRRTSPLSLNHNNSSSNNNTNNGGSRFPSHAGGSGAGGPAGPLSGNPGFASTTSALRHPHSRSDLRADFCGRRSTRLVSKMHFNRFNTAVACHHSRVAEEVLDHVFRICTPSTGEEDNKSSSSSSNNNKCLELENVLVGYHKSLRGTDDYKFIMRELANQGECSMAIQCFEFAVGRERRRNEQGKLTSAIISILGRLGEVDLAKNVFDTAVREGYGNTVYAFSSLISVYGRSGLSDKALRVFESMKTNGLRPNLVTYNAVIDACGKGAVEFRLAYDMYDEMLNNGIKPDRITFNSLLAGCSRGGTWQEARNFFNEMVDRGIEGDLFTYNTFLDAICKGGQMDLAFEIMSQMSERNVVTYSTMIDGYAKAGRLDEAVDLFSEMKFVGIELDRVCYNTMMAVYARLGRFEEASNLCKEMEDSGIKKDSVTYNALLVGYGKHGKFEVVRKLFREMKVLRFSPNILTYSTLIDVYSKGGLYKDALEMYREFKKSSFKADVVLYSAIIDALCKNGLVESAVSLLNQMTKEGVMPNVVTYNSIIDAFRRPIIGEYTDAASGGTTIYQIDSSDYVEDDVENERRDREDNQVMQIFGQLASEKTIHARKHGRGSHEISCVLEVFQKMHELDIKPNVVTFSAILNACSRCNSLEDASMILEQLLLFDNHVYGVTHGLLMGHKDKIWAEAQTLFDGVKQMDSSTASAFYNALTDMLWHYGQKQGAQMVVLEGKHRRVWENLWTDSCLDLHLMSSGAAQALVHAWLLNIRSIVFEGQELPNLLSILTGWGKHSKVVGDGALRRAVKTLLDTMGAPFWIEKYNLGRFISTGTGVAAWLRQSGTLEVLVFHDDRAHPGNSRADQCYGFQALPV